MHADASSPFASRTLETLASLWAIEETVRGHNPTVRKLARQDQSAPIVALLFALWDNALPRLSGKSRLAEAIRYTTSCRAVLERFLAGSDGGGRTSTTIATLITTAKMNGVDPHAWMPRTLERIANRWPNSQIDELMPWNFSH